MSHPITDRWGRVEANLRPSATALKHHITRLDAEIDYIAEKCRVSEETVHDWMEGRSEPLNWQVSQIGVMLGVNPMRLWEEVPDLDQPGTVIAFPTDRVTS